MAPRNRSSKILHLGLGLIVLLWGALGSGHLRAEAAKSPVPSASPTPTPAPVDLVPDEGAPPPKVTPAWAATAIYYEILPSRFRNGDLANDPTIDTVGETHLLPGNWQLSPWTADWYGRSPWEEGLGPNFYENGLSVRRFGGDLEGCIQGLNYLKDLGINAVILTRVFQARADNSSEASSLHHVDASFGPLALEDAAALAKETEDPQTWVFTQADRLLLEFIRQAHDRGIRVLLRIDFTHIGRDFFAFRDLRRAQEASAYKNWFVVTRFDDPATEKSEFKYNGWRGRDSSPEFASNARGLAAGPRAYVTAAVHRWMDPNGDGDTADGVDGWVIDSAPELPMTFWARWHEQLRRQFPDAFTICDTRQSAEGFLKEGSFSAAMDYFGFAVPVKGFFIDGKLKGEDFGALLLQRREVVPSAKLPALLNLIDSSSTDRVASMAQNPATEAYEPSQIPYDVANSAERSESYDIRKPLERTRALQRLIALMQVTYPGAPTIYYGTEAGMWGGDEPDNRMPMVWQDMRFAPRLLDPRGKPRVEDDPNFNLAVHSFYKQVLQLHRDYRALNGGTFSLLEVTGDPRAFAFSRRATNQSLAVVFNRAEEARELLLPAAGAGRAVMIFTTANAPEAIVLQKTPAGLSVSLPGLSGVVIGLGR